MASSVSSSVVSSVVSAVSKAGGSRFSPAATDYFNRLGALRVGTYDAANAALIDRLVGNGGNFWPDSGAFNAMAGWLYPGNGANLIPLHPNHDAGTLNAFVTGDWNAVTGLKGDGSTKYVDSNRAGNVDGQDDHSIGVKVSTAATAGSVYIGDQNTGVADGYKLISRGSADTFFVSSANSSDSISGILAEYLGLSRDNGSTYIARANGVEEVKTRTSISLSALNILLFRRQDTPAYSDARMSFYNIGPNLNGAGELAELDAALTEWQAALASA